MKPLEFHQFPYNNDNYGVLIHSSETGETACVDAGDADAALQALQEKGWTLSHLLITHHHADHTAGLQTIKQATRCVVIGPAPESTPIAGLDQRLGDNDSFQFAGQNVRVLHTPGHTLDMINFYFEDAGAVFTGDTLFAMGCGRLFEGDAGMMQNSLAKLSVLPASTTIYCAHEYTSTNVRFALSVDPDNADLKARAVQVASLREQGQATVPFSLEEEQATNPFLRTDDSGIRRELGMESASELDVFVELRERRNNV